MTLVQKSINGQEYFTDDKVYYTFHQVRATTDTLWDFACNDLGITKKTGFNSQETKDITDLAGISPLHPTKFLLLRNGEAVPFVYLANGSPDLHLADIVLRSAGAPVDPVPAAVVSTPDPTGSIADRLKAIADLHKTKLLTDREYEEKRARIIAEL